MAPRSIDECAKPQATSGAPRKFVGGARVCAAMVLLTLALLCSSAWANPTQQEVFKSISDNVNQQTDGNKLLGAFLAVIGVVIFLAVLSQRRQKRVAPEPVNSQARLLREILKKSPLLKNEAKQLKILSDQQNLTSPLVLLICPSVLAKAIQERNNVKIDKQVIAGVARKLGVLRTQEKT